MRKITTRKIGWRIGFLPRNNVQYFKI